MKRLYVCLAVAALVSSSALLASQRAMRQQQVIIAAVDRDGRTLPDLKAADVVVREDKIAREVLRVEPANAPMQIVVLVDTSDHMQTILQDVRAGLHAFSTDIWAKSPDSEIGLMEFGERPSRLADLSRTPALLDRGINGLVERSNSGAYFLDAVIDATKLLKSHDAKRPVIVSFLRASSTEFSTARYQDVEHAIEGSRASLWTLLLQGGELPSASDEIHNRDVVVEEGAARSGGDRDLLLDRMGIQPQFKQLAERLTSEYAVTYSRPDSLIPPKDLEVTLKRPGARILAPRWIGQ